MPKAKTPPAPAAGKQPKARPSVTGITIQSVMAMTAIRALAQPARIARYTEQATVSQRAFAEMGKLRRAIEADLKAGQDFTNTMRKQGIRDGTISNSSYAAKVFDLVEQGHLGEAQYDTFSFQDCVSIVRAMSAGSAQRLSASEVAVVVNAEPDNFDREFQCLYEHGMTLADKAEHDKAEQKKLNLEAERKLQQQQQQSVPAPSAAPATPAPVAQTTEPAPSAQTQVPAPAETAGEPATEEQESPAPESAQADSPGQSEAAPGPTTEPAETPATEEQPGNVIPMPAQGPEPAGKSKLPQVMNLLDTLELLFAELSVEDARKAFPKLNDVYDTVSLYVASSPEEIAAATAAQKAA